MLEKIIRQHIFHQVGSFCGIAVLPESALLKVHNDILKAVDNRRTVVLLLLDLSAAFDTVDHGRLIHRI